MIFEIGYDQANDLISIADENGFNCQIFKDYGGNDRVAYLRFLPKSNISSEDIVDGIGI